MRRGGWMVAGVALTIISPKPRCLLHPPPLTHPPTLRHASNNRALAKTQGWNYADSALDDGINYQATSATSATPISDAEEVRACGGLACILRAEALHISEANSPVCSAYAALS